MATFIGAQFTRIDPLHGGPWARTRRTCARESMAALANAYGIVPKLLRSTVRTVKMVGAHAPDKKAR